ncbi:MAG TPA: T9SS type A sorting domain-containing protein [Bacteroidales bacterium]|nr:T9SS type A sorting domain-containing protein [Bacteroidales bacterium]
MKRNLISLVIAILAITTSAFAQIDDAKIKALRKAALEEMKYAPEDAHKDYYEKMHSRIPRKLDVELIDVQDGVKSSTKAPLDVPADMIYPGEFDEVQAIMMTWPYITRTVSGNQYASQMFEGQGMTYSSQTLVPVYSVPDVSNNKTTKLFRELANGIQQNAEVWINIWNAEDSVTIKQHMLNFGTPLNNYRFFINQGNSFWYRDCGPVGFYYGDDDQIGLMDFEYYGGRPLDDLLGRKIGEQAGFPTFTTTIEYEGGNILVDGLGSLFTSTAVYAINKDANGLYYLNPNSSIGYSQQSKTRLTETQIVDSLKHLMNLNRCIVLPELKYDGGTGHIDLYTDFFDESTFVSTKHPDVMANLSDPIKVEKNMDSVVKMFTSAPFGSTYYNTRIPLPAKNNGTWYTSQSEYNNTYTRSFSNHTMVNGAIMQPMFYSGNEGDVAGNQAALAKMQEAYPGYEFVEIDVRDFDGYGGAIHCITKQIPAENPVRIYHYPVRWLNTTEKETNDVWLTATVQNKSGIENAILYYRTKGEENFNNISMNIYDGNIYDAVLPINKDLAADTIEYYISAKSNNGKTITKPMTAPKGYYTFIYGTEVQGNSDYIGLDCMEDIKAINLGEFYPNPAQNSTKIEITQGAKADVPVKVINLKGQVLLTTTIKKGQTSLELNTSEMRSGNYWAIFGDNTNVSIKKIVIVK